MAGIKKGSLEEEKARLRGHPLMREILADLKKQSRDRVDQLLSELSTMTADEEEVHDGPKEEDT